MASSIPSTSARYQTYEARLPLHSNPSSRALLETVIRKRSNLSVSVDVTTKRELLEIVEAVGEFVVCVKVRRLSAGSQLARASRGRRARAGRTLDTGGTATDDQPLTARQTHCDIVNDWDQDLVDQLTALSKKLDFQIFEDRKFADIGAYGALAALGRGLDRRLTVSLLLF
jgi:orotidine-5'-phosphate decarboxylase